MSAHLVQVGLVVDIWHKLEIVFVTSSSAHVMKLVFYIIGALDAK